MMMMMMMMMMTTTMGFTSAALSQGNRHRSSYGASMGLDFGYHIMRKTS
jgi:hypothetical protein